jgi:hypothetical protein
MLNSMVREAMKSHPCKTLVIDTIDWAEQLCIIGVCSKNSKTGIEDFGYGKGYVYERKEFGKFLNLLQEVVDSGIHVVLTAHAQLKKFEQPDEMGSYDRWELKLGQKTGSQISPLVKEWADTVLFANYKTVVVATDKEGKKFKAQGGQRVMYTSHNPCWDAKNRDGLAPELPFEYGQVAHLFSFSSQTEKQKDVTADRTAPEPEKAQTVQTSVPRTATAQQAEENFFEGFEDVTPREINIPDSIPKVLADLMRANRVDESDIRLAVSQRGYFTFDTPITSYPPDFVNGCLVGAWEQLLPIIKENQKIPF